MPMGHGHDPRGPAGNRLAHSLRTALWEAADGAIATLEAALY